MRVAAYLPFLRKRPHARYRELEARIMIDFLMSVLCTPIRSHTDKTSNLKFFDRGAAATLVIEIWLAGKLVWHARKTILDNWHERSHHSVTRDQLLCEASFFHGNNTCSNARVVSISVGKVRTRGRPLVQQQQIILHPLSPLLRRKSP